jgi:hypothetical protein
MFKLDATSQRIIKNIVNRQHVAAKTEQVIKEVFKKINSSQLDAEKTQVIKDFIVKTHDHNFIFHAAVVSGKI